MLKHEELRNAFLHCIVQGDKEMWNMIYPALIENKIPIDKEIIEYFARIV